MKYNYYKYFILLFILESALPILHDYINNILVKKLFMFLIFNLYNILIYIEKKSHINFI